MRLLVLPGLNLKAAEGWGFRTEQNAAHNMLPVIYRAPRKIENGVKCLAHILIAKPSTLQSHDSLNKKQQQLRDLVL